MDKNLLENGQSLQLQFDKRGGLLPCVTQDASNGDILMIGYVNVEALNETIKTGMATFWSTSRNELWTKGKTSGDYLKLVEILVDCDQDALIYKVNVLGDGVCHTKNKTGETRRSCFYRKLDVKSNSLDFLIGNE